MAQASLGCRGLRYPGPQRRGDAHLLRMFSAATNCDTVREGCRVADAVIEAEGFPVTQNPCLLCHRGHDRTKSCKMACVSDNVYLWLHS